MTLFTEVDRLKEELDTLRPISAEQEARILQKFRLEWNYNSNAIEGNSLTLGETRSLLLHGLTAEGKPLRDHLDIQGHDEAVRGLEEIVHDERPLTEQFIREMHQVLLGETHYKPANTASGQPTRQRIVPGQYKSSPNNVRTATGETFYFASPEETPAKMNDLMVWYRQEIETPTLHPVALAAEFHHRFVSIHPFDDGNGRMSRLLMNLILMRSGYPITVIKANDRNRYLAGLSEADAGEQEPFLRFIAENVESSLRLMIRAAKGESIEEPGDLDKKVALLKKQLTRREDFGKATWNLVTQKRFYNIVLKPWLEDLIQELARFDDLFIETRMSFDSRDINRQSFQGKSGPTAMDALGSAGEIFSNGDNLVSEATFYIQWNKFCMPAVPFDQGAQLALKFEQYRYDISFSVYERQKNGHSYSLEEIFNSTYLASPDLEAIQKLNHKLAGKVYGFIEAKLAQVSSTG